ncbi:hypothetical protein [Haliscomenobacter sp.]|uniref:hypothetical protein n=1 Tax=Haliscomenobacter sp. TaxID=2717303 RepID=UPI003BAC9522
MKTKIFTLFLGLFFILSIASAQSVALTGFNGRIDFSGFANNGPNIRGTLKNFADQTGLYVISNIDTGDIAWDNNGKRYAVVGVISSTGTQAVVDLSRIGGGTHLPKGAGFVSRETSNGLALIPPQNSNGISAPLASRVGVHNAKILEGLWPRYKTDTIYGNLLHIKQAYSADQDIFIGASTHPRANDWPFNNTWKASGFYSSPWNWGTVGILNADQGRGTMIELSPFSASVSGWVSTSDPGYTTKAVVGRSIEAVAAKDATSGINVRSYMGPQIYGRDNIDALAGLQLTSNGQRSASVAMRFTENYNPFSSSSSKYMVFLGRDSTNSWGGIGVFQSMPDYQIPTFAVRQTNIDNSVMEWLKITMPYSDLTTNGIRFYGKYDFANATPSATIGAKTIHLLTGDGTTTTPALLRIQNGVSSASTDGSGDLTVTVPTMPDATYSTNVTVEGTTSYTVSVHTKTTTSFKVRFFNPATGAAVTATSVSCSYHIQDY